MVELGDEVKDKVSGFQGIAVARHSYLQGCNRITIQPPIGTDGKLPDSCTFDEPLLDVVTAGKVKREAGAEINGGPDKYMPGKRAGE